jgi:hypothetical protein
MKTHELSLCRSGFCDVLSMLRADAKAMLAEDARRQFPNRTSDRWHSRFVRMLTGEHDGNNNMFSSSWGGGAEYPHEPANVGSARPLSKPHRN